MTVSTYSDCGAGVQSAQPYPSCVQGDIAVLARIAASFAPHESGPPTMFIMIDSGHLVYDGQLVEKAAQVLGSLSVPASNPRIDRIVLDRSSGNASIITGAEGVSPVAPAIPLNAIPVARIALMPTTTAITNAVITDERDFTSYRSTTASGGLLNVQTFATAGTYTYTPTPGTTSIIVEVQGAGGSGGGTAATSSSTVSASSGGGAGAYVRSRITSGFAGASIVVGAGATAPAAGANNGSVGGTSSFGSVATAPGGSIGYGFAAYSPGTTCGSGGASAAPTGGNILNAPGATGFPGLTLSLGAVMGGNGGSSFFGGGGQGVGSGPGSTGAAPGAGGGGTGAAANVAARSAGAGAAGIVIVHEFS